MSEAFKNKTVLMDIITKEVSKNSSSGLNYDYEEVIADASSAIANYKSSISVDKRVVAVGADLYIHLWEPWSALLDGWKERMFISAGLYAQMVLDIGKPTSTLFTTPDRHFDTVALCAERGMEIYFLNNDSLFNFENFIRDLPSYPFNFNYNVIEFSDFIEDTSLSFDFIQMFSSDFVLDNDLIDAFVDRISSGGFGYISATNEETRLYSEDYFIEPISHILDALNAKDEVSTYHIPNAHGCQVIVKD
jgi:hypothetical protein